MPDYPPLDKVLSDPDFKGLPAPEQRKALTQMYPEFGGLPETEQNKVIGFKGSTPAPPQDSAALRFAKGAYQSTIGSAVDTVKSMYGGPHQSDLAANSKRMADAVGKGDVKGFLSGAADQFLGGVMNPVHGIVDASKDQISKAGKEKTATGKAARYAAAIPVVGPTVAGIAEQAAGGDWAGAAGQATGLVGPAVLGAVVPEKLPLGPIMKDRSTPLRKAAMNEAEARGIPLTPGQRTGNETARYLESKLEHTPGAAGPAHRFAEKQRDAVISTLNDLPKQVGGTATDATGAGTEAVAGINARNNALKGYADRQYNGIRKELDDHKNNVLPQRHAAAMNQYHQDIQAYMANPAGKTAPTIPVKPQFAAEVPMNKVRQDLKPIFDEVDGTLTDMDKSTSQGYAVLKRLVNGTEDVRDPMSVDKDLSAIKGMVRRAGSGPMSPSQRMQVRTISKLEAQMEKSLHDVNPALVTRLKNGRSAWKEYHKNNDLLNRLLPNDEKGASVVYQNLTKRGASQLPDIIELKRVAPGAEKTVAQTLLHGMVEKVLREGGVSKTGSVLNEWNNLDTRVKHELFGAPQAKSIDRLLTAVKDIGLDLNPSRTAKWQSFAKGFGAIGSAVAALATGHPGALALTAAAGAGLNALSRLMFSPTGTRLLTEVIERPLGSHAQRAAMAKLQVVASTVGNSQPKQPKTAAPPKTQSASPPTAAPEEDDEDAAMPTEDEVNADDSQ
jgi:hypothetical protein